MSKGKPVTHVGIYGKEVACFHCGARDIVIHGPGIPIASPAWDGMMAHCASFEKKHAQCRETADSPTRKLEANEHEWAKGLFVGTSSATIFKVMTGRWPESVEGRADVPHDPADFSRCHRLLQVKPEWLLRLGEVPAAFPAWGLFVDHWDELTAMFERKDPGMYDRMQSLKKEPLHG